MTRSKVWGKTPAKMQILQRTLVLGAFTLLWACQPKLYQQRGTYWQPSIQDSVPYLLSQHREASDRLLIYLPPALDSFNLESSSLFRPIFNAGYDVLSLYKAPAKGDDYYRRKSMDVKLQRLQNIEYLIMDLKKRQIINPQAEIVILGIEEGAYLAPSVALSLGVDSIILVNGGPFSMFFQIQRIAEAELALTPARRAFINRHFRTDSLALLMEKVQAVESQHPDLFSLGSFPNMYWTSYHLNYFMDEFPRVPGLVVNINFEDYPLFKPKDLEFFRVLTKMRPSEKTIIHRLEGDGSLDKAQQEMLWQVLAPLFTD